MPTPRTSSPVHAVAFSRKREPLLVRFSARVDRRGPDDCWEWVGSLSVKGYGLIRLGRKTIRAHRLAFEVANGAIPDGLFGNYPFEIVRHKE